MAKKEQEIQNKIKVRVLKPFLYEDKHPKTGEELEMIESDVIYAVSRGYVERI